MVNRYLCQEAQSNKFWEYEIKGNDVFVAWGRVGLDGQNKTHSFSSTFERDDFIAKKIAEKKKKGYLPVTAEKLNQEKDIAKSLGFQYKIKRVQWVSVVRDAKGQPKNKINFLLGYDPTQFVYVEVLNSWDDSVKRILLSKSESWLIDGVAESNRTIEFESRWTAPSNLVDGIKKYLRGLAQKVVAAIAKVGAMGARTLDLGISEDSDELIPEQMSEQGQSFMEAVGDSGASAQVISKLSGLGDRLLDL